MDTILKILFGLSFITWFCLIVNTYFYNKELTKQNKILKSIIDEEEERFPHN